MNWSANAKPNVDRAVTTSIKCGLPKLIAVLVSLSVLMHTSLWQSVTVRPQTLRLAIQAAREREKTEAFKKQYAQRAGVEGTILFGVRSFVLRQTRNLGLAKTNLQNILIDCAINLMRITRWLKGRALLNLAYQPSPVFIRLPIMVVPH